MKIFFKEKLCDLYEFIDEIEEICNGCIENQNMDARASIEAIAEIISDIKEIIGDK